MSKLAIGSKAVVLLRHSVVWETPYPKTGEILTVTAHHPLPHGYGVPTDVYITENEDGKRVVVRADHVSPYVPQIPSGTLVFVKETHDTGDGDTVYAGARLEILIRRPPFYTARNTETGRMVQVLETKVAPVEYERLDPPLPPALAGYDGQKFYHVSATDLGGYWEYSTYWGWSNFVADFPQRYKEQKAGKNLWSVGVRAEK